MLTTSREGEMAISDKDIKLLWSRAAGRCSAPHCSEELMPRLAKSGSCIMGEMAHVIGRRSGAPRSDPAVGANDKYENLILLCPNHHTLVDKAPSDFPVSTLRKWKSDWEEQVRRRLHPRISIQGGTPLEMRLWTYFNFDLILKMIESKATPQSIQRLRLLDESGFPINGPDFDAGTETLFDTWPNDLARHIQSHYSGLVEDIIFRNRPIDLDEIWGIRKLDGLLYPTAIAFTNRRCFFKTAQCNGKHELRDVRSKAGSIELRFQIDAWNIFSSSSYRLHFKGSSRVAALLFIRSVDRERLKSKPTLVIKATPIAIGTGFWSTHDRTPEIAYRDQQIDDDEDSN